MPVAATNSTLLYGQWETPSNMPINDVEVVNLDTGKKSSTSLTDNQNNYSTEKYFFTAGLVPGRYSISRLVCSSKGMDAIRWFDLKFPNGSGFSFKLEAGRPYWLGSFFVAMPEMESKIRSQLTNAIISKATLSDGKNMLFVIVDDIRSLYTKIPLKDRAKNFLFQKQPNSGWKEYFDRNK